MSQDNIEFVAPFNVIGASAPEADGAVPVHLPVGRGVARPSIRVSRADEGPTGKKSPNARRSGSTDLSATTWGLGQLIGMGEWELLPVEAVG